MSTPSSPSSSPSDSQTALRKRRQSLRHAWNRIVREYDTVARRPFGSTQRGREVWVQFGRQTTAN